MIYELNADFNALSLELGSSIGRLGSPNMASRDGKDASGPLGRCANQVKDGPKMRVK